MKATRRIAGWLVILFLLPVTVSAQSLSPETQARLHPAFQKLLSAAPTTTSAGKSAAQEQGEIIVTYSDDGEPLYTAIVYTDDPQAVVGEVEREQSVYQGFFTALLTRSELLRLASNEHVRFIDPGSRNYPVLDVSVPETGASLLHAGLLNNTPYRGKGAIVLIYDTGIDWRHLDFRMPDDTTKSRILYIWDQTLNPVQGEQRPQGFFYGVEYTRAQIEDELDGSPAGFVRTKDTNGHGTHVASTAAGNGASLQKRYVGMAPEADIIVVKGGDESFSEPRMIDGLTYAERKARELGKPIVVNWSIGGQQGPHDGTRSYEIAVDQFMQKRGQVVVIAAGNEGGQKIHIGGTIPKSEGAIFKITVPQYEPESGKGNDQFVLDLWFDGQQAVVAEVRSPNGISVVANPGQNSTSSDKSDGNIELRNFINNLNGNRNIYLEVSDTGIQAGNPQTGEWTLVLSGASDNLRYDGWLAEYKLGNSTLTLQGADTERTVSMPGTSREAITVGSYVTKWSWPASNGKNYVYSNNTDRTNTISSFSGIGPTRDGRLKPNITAPGQGIAAALSSDATASETRIQPGGRHYLIQGTSMATPHVAGAAALLLAELPTMTGIEIRNLLLETAAQDEWTGSVPNTTWGFGKLDIFAAMVKALTGQTGVVRKTYAYDRTGNNSIVTLTGNTRYAVRFTPEVSGLVTGVKLNLTTQGNNPIVGGGPLLVEIYTNAQGSLFGVPGQQLGSTVAHDFAQLSSGIYNYINMIGAGVQVQAGVDYHVVLSLANATDTLVIRTDSNPSTAERSSVFRSGQWFNFADPSSGLPAINLRLRVEVTHFDATTVVRDDVPVPTHYMLEQNYPNPFNPETIIAYTLPRDDKVRLAVYNLLGQHIVDLVSGRQEAGRYRITWSGRDALGRRVPTGVYVYRLETETGIRLSRKMLLLR